MTDTQMDLQIPRSHNSRDYFRGVSTTLVFLFVVAAFASNTPTHRLACIGAAVLTAGAALTANHLVNKKERRLE